MWPKFQIHLFTPPPFSLKLFKEKFTNSLCMYIFFLSNLLQLCFSRIPFCSYSYVVLMPKKRQALVEYEDMTGSCNAVTYANDNQIYIAGNPAYVNYSTSQKISRPGNSDDSRSVNNVLLFTIMNPIYPITTVILSQAFWDLFTVLYLH